MADFEIQIKTEGAGASAKEFEKVASATDKVTDATKSYGAETEQLTVKKGKLLAGLKALGHEIPIVGALLNALKNPWTVLGVAAVTAVAAIRKALADLKADHVDLTLAAQTMSTLTVQAYSNAQAAVAALATAQDDLNKKTKTAIGLLEDQIAKRAEEIEQQIKVLEAEKEVEAARIERDTKDPVERARALKENNLTFGARILSLRGSLPGQQAQLVQKQIEEEQRHRVEAQEELPDEKGLRAAVAGVEKDRAALQSATAEGRKAFASLALLQRAGRIAEGSESDNFFAEGDVATLMQMGIVTSYIAGKGGSKLGFDASKIGPLMSGAEEQIAATKEQTAKARSAYRSSIGTLPKGVATEADIPGYMAEAESKAAGTMTASAGRQERLEILLEKLLAQQQNTVEVGRRQQQAGGIRGDISINEAQQRQDDKDNEDKKRILESVTRGHGAVQSNGSGVSNMVEGLINVIETQGAKLRALNDRIRKLENREINQR